MPTDQITKAAQIERDLAIMESVRKLDAEEKEKEAKEMEKKDADAGEKIDKILAYLDSFTSKLDSVSSRMDAMDKARADGAEAALLDKKKKDAAEEEEGEAEKIPFRKDGLLNTRRGGEPMGISEKGDPKELRADAFADSGYTYGRAVTDAQRDELSDVQSACETVHSAWGNNAPRPYMNELPHEYRRRTARQLSQHSKDWKDVDLKELSPEALKIATKQIYADAFAASTADATYEGLGQLHCIRKVNRDTGHIEKTFFGQPRQWMEQFSGQRRLAKFNLNAVKR